MITWGRTWWPLFLIISAVWVTLGFGVPEIIALLTERSRHTDNTLSNYSWHELNVSTQLTVHTLAWWFTFIPVCVIGAVLVLHIWFRFGSGA